MNKLKELRKMTKKTIEEVANEVGLPKTTYFNYESGRNEIDRELLIRFADYYDVSLDYLYDRPYNNGVGYIPENRKELVKEIIELSDADAKEVQVFLKGYKAGKAGASEITIFN